MRSSTSTSIKFLSVAFALMLGSGCGEDLSSELMKEGETPPLGQMGHITNSEAPNGSISTRVDASNATSWIYFQLQTGKEATPQDPQNSTEWELALQRFNFKINGGSSGSGGATVTAITGTAFEALTQAPATGYITDQPDSADEGEEPDYGFTQLGPWYNYNASTHILTPKEMIYVVHVTSGYYKVQVTAYYDGAGSSGFPTFRWQSVTAP